MKYILFYILCLVALLVQASSISAPLVLGILLMLFIYEPRLWVFMLAFVSGIVLDILLVYPVGWTSIFLLSFLFLVSLYERKFEIRSYHFVFLSLFLGCFFYYIFWGIDGGMLRSFLLALTATSGFYLFEKWMKKKETGYRLT